MAMIERRVGDGSILRLIRKWIHVGVIEDGRLLVSERGTGQGQVISPLLSNIYLHVVLDQWFENEVKPRLKGKAFEVRYADDGLLFFQQREDAERVLQVLHKRFAKFGLTLHPEKTCLLEFGRLAHWQGRRTGVKPATFDFLGFTHVTATSLRGKFTIHLKTMKERLRRAIKATAAWCQEHRHSELAHQWTILTAKLRGHYQYYGRPTNYRSLRQFYRVVRRLWYNWLNRRTRGKTLKWKDYARILEHYPLPRPKITRAWMPAQ
jgi:RNA-directed DNA polymerase